MRPLLFAIAGVLFVSLPIGRAAQKTDARQELNALAEKIRAKLGAEEPSEAALADEIREFDAIVARHAGEKTDAVAEVLLMKATLYFEVLGEPEKAQKPLERIKAEFPGTKIAAQAAEIQQAIVQEAAKKKIRDELKVGAKFPDFAEKDLDGNPLSLSALKGKVVLVDFWATWCPPCRMALPGVRAAYEKFHPDGFEIVGVSLDQNKGTLQKFLRAEKIAWPQYFDGLGWSNKLAEKYGVSSIPTTYLLDRRGRIVGSNLEGGELEAAVAKALGRK